MKIRILTVSLIAMIIASLAFASDGKPPAENGDYDFGSKVLVVVTRPRDSKSSVGGSYIEKVALRKLGTHFFLVGQIVDMGPAFQQAKGTIIWTPITEIIQITEYENTELMKKAFEENRKPKVND